VSLNEKAGEAFKMPFFQIRGSSISVHCAILEISADINIPQVFITVEKMVSYRSIFRTAIVLKEILGWAQQ